MALQHNIADANQMRMDVEKGNPVIEIQFRFVRYRLVIDDDKWGWKLHELIEQALKTSSGQPAEDTKMPKFYKNSDGDTV